MQMRFSCRPERERENIDNNQLHQLKYRHKDKDEDNVLTQQTFKQNCSSPSCHHLKQTHTPPSYRAREVSAYTLYMKLQLKLKLEPEPEQLLRQWLWEDCVDAVAGDDENDNGINGGIIPKDTDGIHLNLYLC